MQQSTNNMGETHPENLKQMIRDSLLLVCRQGIECELRFAVHAVIGVTVDDDQSFYLHIDENIDRDSPSGPSEPSARSRRTRSTTRKRSSRGSNEGATSPKRILLSEWMTKQGKSDDGQPMHWSVVKVKTEQKDEDSEDVTAVDDEMSRSTLSYSSASKEGSSVIQNKLHRITCVPLYPPKPATAKRKRPNQAQKTREYRARLKQNKEKWEEHLIKERIRKKRNRERETEEVKQKRSERKKRNYHEKRKQENYVPPEEIVDAQGAGGYLNYSGSNVPSTEDTEQGTTATLDREPPLQDTYTGAGLEEIGEIPEEGTELEDEV